MIRTTVLGAAWVVPRCSGALGSASPPEHLIVATPDVVSRRPIRQRGAIAPTGAGRAGSLAASFWSAGHETADHKDYGVSGCDRWGTMPRLAVQSGRGLSTLEAAVMTVTSETRSVAGRATALYRRAESVGQSCLGLALLVIAVSQLMVLLDVEAVCGYRREVPQAWTAAGRRHYRASRGLRRAGLVGRHVGRQAFPATRGARTRTSIRASHSRSNFL